MYDFKFLLIFPQLLLLTLCNFQTTGIKEAGWIPLILSFILCVICFIGVLKLVDIKDEEVSEFKVTGITLFVLYILINIVYFGVLFYYRSHITDMEALYIIIGLSVTQTSIFGYFLSNLFPPKDNTSPPEDQDLL